VLRTGCSRWIATADESGFEGATLGGEIFDPGLRVAVSGLCIRIPPLRERPRLLARFANETARAWCRARGERPRRLGEDAVQVLEEYPWPGNLRELESVVEQTLATGGSDPIRADDLQHEGTAFAPIDASAIGTLLSEDEELEFQTERPPSAAIPTTRTIPSPDPGPPPAAAIPTTRTIPSPDPGPPPAAAIPTTRTPPSPDPEPLELRPEDAITAKPPQKAEPERSPEPPAPPSRADGDLKRLVGAVAHEVRNPLTAIRSFAQLLPERYQDPEFRSRFSALVGQGVERIERVVEHLDRLGSLGAARSIPTDVTTIVSGVLEERRDRIREQRLLVLEELESTHPRALTDPDLLRVVLESVFDKVLELVPERGDVYVASRHHPEDARGRAALRVLLRFGGGGRGSRPGLSPAENALEFAVAESVLTALGGRFSTDTSETGETRVLIDLPAA
jgi:hypothetical protein